MTTIHSRAERARERLGAPALALGMVDADGRLECAVTGTRRLGADDPVTADDTWHIGSCGKALTAALYARLVEAGLARWAAPLPEVFDDLRLAPGWASVTVDDLILCVAGEPANLDLRTDAWWRDTRPLPEQRTAVATDLFACPPAQVGKFVYSNLGFTVVGAAIERITGETFEAALQKHLFTPLGITSAGFGPPPRIWGHRGRRRFGNLIVGRASAVDPANLVADNPPVIAPAGRVHLTIADWAKFQRLWLAGNDLGLLSDSSVRHMLTARKGTPLAMGWAPNRGGPVSFAQQGSNTNWAATALLGKDRRRSVMLVVNDGRTAVLVKSPKLALPLLTQPAPGASRPL